MTEGEAPDGPDDLALARVLDGLGPDSDADPAALAAHERAAADVDAIARALGLIGDTLGAEPLAVEAAEEVVAPASGIVVPLRRRLSWAPPAAAASVVVALGLGTVVALNHDGGSGSASSVAQAPAPAAAPDSAMAPMQGHSLMAVPAPAPLAAAAAPAAGTTASSSGAAAKSAAAVPTAPSFAAAVGCARGILLGKVVSVTGAGGGQYTLVLQVIDWISSGSGSSVTYQVGSAYAADDSTVHRLTVGQQRVFIVPQDPSAQIRAYPDSPSLRSRIAQAQATGQSCG